MCHGVTGNGIGIPSIGLYTLPDPPNMSHFSRKPDDEPVERGILFSDRPIYSQECDDILMIKDWRFGVHSLL